MQRKLQALHYITIIIYLNIDNVLIHKLAQRKQILLLFEQVGYPCIPKFVVIFVLFQHHNQYSDVLNFNYLLRQNLLACIINQIQQVLFSLTVVFAQKVLEKRN